jgi:hypothetical protein
MARQSGSHQDIYPRMLERLASRGRVVELSAGEEEEAREGFLATFGAMFDPATAPATGSRAEAQYSQQQPGAVLVLSQNRRGFTPHMSASPLPFALLCSLREGEPPPPLGAFCKLEPCVVADDFAWAMVHTHEDHALGGPYFVRAERVYSGPRHPSR